MTDHEKGLAMNRLESPLPQPRPLRVLAALTAMVTLIVGGLPTMGVPLTAEQTGLLVGIVGALAAVAVALIGEQHVTPVNSPRDNDGTLLVRVRPPEGPGLASKP